MMRILDGGYVMSDGGGIVKIDLDKVDWRGSREFFDSLAAALEKLDDKDESYDFTWIGKRKAIIEAGTPINKTLRPDVAASKNWDTTENLFIEGDNLDTLKLLQESYLGKIKMIYIDPPYNTGKDFVYHDNFKASTEQYDEDTEYRDDKGNIQFKKNEKSNGRYHSDWLSMMYPRLKLARNLLTDDGVIFISIDDNEQANLTKLCEEVFGEDNFEGNIHWRRRHNQPNDPTKLIGLVAEHILVFAKNSVALKKSGVGKLPLTGKFANPDNDPRGNWNSKPWRVGVGQNGSKYVIVTPSGEELHGEWMGEKNTFDKLLADNRIYFPNEGSGTPRKKIFETERVQEGQSATNWFPHEQFGNNQQASRETEELFDGYKKIFDNPKPTQLINNLIRLGNLKNGDIVMDFFSGSATTAHATMQLNAEDNVNRKWIMVQLPEETDEKSEAYKAGYTTIPEISRERIRRAGDKIAAEYPDAKVDYGFRALTIADANYKNVYKPASQLQQGDLLASVDNVKEDRTDLDLLYGVLTQSAFELNRPISTAEIAGAAIYRYDYSGEASGLIACFAKDVPEEAIKAIAALKPLTAVFRDSSFADSQAKVNLSEHFRILSPDTKVKVI